MPHHTTRHLQTNASEMLLSTWSFPAAHRSLVHSHTYVPFSASVAQHKNLLLLLLLQSPRQRDQATKRTTRTKHATISERTQIFWLVSPSAAQRPETVCKRPLQNAVASTLFVAPMAATYMGNSRKNEPGGEFEVRLSSVEPNSKSVTVLP